MRSNILKIALFATGLSGIVAEYNLSTLASYFLGDSVFQWTMIVSVMLFSMGLGSRLSKIIKTDLLKKFIIIEFVLSLTIAFSSLFTYVIHGFTVYSAVAIYFFSIFIGILIGTEIPLVIRLNKEYETLRINVASVIEKDYYGSLVGGVLFAFVGLPYLGLTFTPFVLGIINFSVALLLLFLLLEEQIKKSKIQLISFSIFTGIMLIIGLFIARPIVMYSEQRQYKDKVILSAQSKYQKIVITMWKKNFWLYINGNQQLCTIDEVMYHEPLVHPAMQLLGNPQNVLILGGGDGCATREVLKYKSVEKITLVDLDPVMTNLAKTNPVLTKLNNNSFNNNIVEIFNKDAFKYIEKCELFFDVIIIDLPDPRTVELGRLYSQEFYKLCYKKLRPNGVIVTQAGSPYFATKSFICINKTVESAGFSTIPIHNQVITMGEWGWIIGTKKHSNNLKNIVRKLKFDNINTQWINNEAMLLMTSFGKDFFIDTTKTIEINQIHNPVLYHYYLKGNWDLY